MNERAGNVLLSEDFSRGMGNWWIEGGQKVCVNDGHLLIEADPEDGGAGKVCTVWCRTPIRGDFRLSYNARVISSSVGVNNINFFFCYSDPAGVPLESSRNSRADGDYKKYHNLNGYIVTFLNDVKGEGGVAADGGKKARMRMRRCPGFALVDETYGYHCRRERTYQCEIIRWQGEISFAVDGNVYLRMKDTEPHAEGLIGLRTFRTKLWFDSIRVEALP